MYSCEAAECVVSDQSLGITKLIGLVTVHVLSGKELRSHLLSIRRAQPVGEQHQAQIAYQLEHRCRNIVPLYAQ